MTENSGKRPKKRFTWLPDGHFFYPWERTFERLITPFEEFIERQTTSGLVLMMCTLLALLLANSPVKEAYDHLIHSEVCAGIFNWQLKLSVLHWINEGFMGFFFFVVGLEIKREILVGELSDLKCAGLPLVAAIGGMMVPALIYYLFNPLGEYAAGWGIPMTTDIAFCIGALVLLGKRIPQSLMIFLVALAIVDDLGAVAIIAFFYTESIQYVAFGFAAGFFFLLMIFNLSGIRRSEPYLFIGMLFWLAMLHSGIHAAVSGALIAFCIPARGRYYPAIFGDRLRHLAKQFDDATRAQECLLGNIEQQAVLKAIDREGHLAESPLQRMLDYCHLPVALVVIPLFALANAGIRFDFSSFIDLISHPVNLGVICGLVLGKPIGITLFSWMFIKTKIVALPLGASMRHVIGVGLLGGIGFTMSIFIAELSFPDQMETLAIAKAGIIIASLIAGTIGIVWLLYTIQNEKEVE
jgi:NhaA family Na+:H+ antiporter